MAVFDEISAHLVAQVIAGGATGWDIWANWMPDDPDRVILLKDLPGRPPEDFSDTDFALFEVRVRGGSDESGLAEAKLDEIFVDIHRQVPTTLSGTSWGGIRAVSKPAWFRVDKAGRDEFIATFEGLRART